MFAVTEKLFSFCILTKSVLGDQFSAQYDKERKTLLKPAEETAKLGQRAAGFTRVQIRVRRVQIWFWTGEMLCPIMSMWVWMGVAVGVDPGPPGWRPSAGLHRCICHRYPHVVVLGVGGNCTGSWCPGEKLWLQSQAQTISCMSSPLVWIRLH